MQGKTVSNIYCSGLGTTFKDVDVELETALKDDFVDERHLRRGDKIGEGTYGEVQEWPRCRCLITSV